MMSKKRNRTKKKKVATKQGSPNELKDINTKTISPVEAINPKKNSPQIPKKNPKSGQPLRRILLFIWTAYGAVAAFATIWIAVNPRVYVYPSINLDPTNPVFTPFVVRNEGYLTIRNVKFSCAIKYIKYPGPKGTQIIGVGKYENEFYDPKQVALEIAPGEEASEILPLSGMKHNQFENADIAVRLIFSPFRLWPFLLWEKEELHRFELKTGKNGQRHWFPQPVNK